MKTALITGITGQDGSYLAELLLEKGYEVHGIVRRTSGNNAQRISHLNQDVPPGHRKLHFHYGDVTDPSRISHLIQKIMPDEIYNLAAQSHVMVSFEQPEYTSNVVGLGALRILEAINNINKKIKFYQASSSEMFGNSQAPQNENSTFNPRSPYAVSKVFAHQSVINYREAYNIYACNGIMFNHESPRRGEDFVSRKITRGIAKILSKKERVLFFGNIEAKRDWGYAKDYVEAMWLMLQQDDPEDYVIATGESRTVKEFIEVAFDYVGLPWREHIKIDERFMRPLEVNQLVGDSSKAKKRLGWQPKLSFENLVKLMVEEDLRAEGLDPENIINRER